MDNARLPAFESVSANFAVISARLAVSITVAPRVFNSAASASPIPLLAPVNQTIFLFRELIDGARGYPEGVFRHNQAGRTLYAHESQDRAALPRSRWNGYSSLAII